MKSVRSMQIMISPLLTKVKLIYLADFAAYRDCPVVETVLLLEQFLAQGNIGCILLESPFFFERADWIPLPDWKREIVRGRGYDSEGDGAGIWERVELLIRAPQVFEGEAAQVSDSRPRYGKPTTVLPRLGQGSFRLIVTHSYNRRCAFTDSPVLHVLEAAHIRPYGGDDAPLSPEIDPRMIRERLAKTK